MSHSRDSLWFKKRVNKKQKKEEEKSADLRRPEGWSATAHTHTIISKSLLSTFSLSLSHLRVFYLNFFISSAHFFCFRKVLRSLLTGVVKCVNTFVLQITKLNKTCTVNWIKEVLNEIGEKHEMGELLMR